MGFLVDVNGGGSGLVEFPYIKIDMVVTSFAIFDQSTTLFGIAITVNELQNSLSKMTTSLQGCVLYGQRDLLGATSELIMDWAYCLDKDKTIANSVNFDGTDFIATFFVDDATFTYTGKLILLKIDTTGTVLLSSVLDWNGSANNKLFYENCQYYNGYLHMTG